MVISELLVFFFCITLCDHLFYEHMIDGKTKSQTRNDFAKLPRLNTSWGISGVYSGRTLGSHAALGFLCALSVVVWQ